MRDPLESKIQNRGRESEDAAGGSGRVEGKTWVSFQPNWVINVGGTEAAPAATHMRWTLLWRLLPRLPDLRGRGKAPSVLGYPSVSQGWGAGREGTPSESWGAAPSSAMPPDPSVSNPATGSVHHLLGPSLGRSWRLWQKSSLTFFSWNFFPSCLREWTEMFSFTCVNLGVSP